jgi:hypothetical protein
MGLENEFQELEQDATGQGGNDGDNNANNACALPASPCHHCASNSRQQRQQRQDCGHHGRFWYAIPFSPRSPISFERIQTDNVDAAIDQFASKEGLPAGLDPEMNNMVNDEINKL